MCLFNKKKKDPTLEVRTKIKELTTMSELATCEYEIDKVIASIDHSKTWGDKKLVYTCKVYVKAGIDLENYDSSKTVIDPLTHSISLTLPKAKILSHDIPREEIKKIYESVGFWRSNNSCTDEASVLAQGEDSILKALGKVEKDDKDKKSGDMCKKVNELDLNILADAEQNTRDLFRAALMQLGYETINIRFEKE